MRYKLLGGLLGVAVILFLVFSYSNANVLPAQYVQVETQWSEVQNQYQRRADLLPNLAAVVKGYAHHEQDVLIGVIEQRAKATSVQVNIQDAKQLAEYQNNQQMLTQALSKLMVANERYPDLKADKQFLALQSQIEGTENRIAYARSNWIKSTVAFNTNLVTFPQVIMNKVWYHYDKVIFIADTQKAPALSF